MSNILRPRRARPAINISLRGITLLSKFALIFFLALFLEPKELGLYGLLTVSVSYAIYFVGFDFYTYSTRELLGEPYERWAGMLRDQGVYFLIAYALVLPLLLLPFAGGWLPWRLAGWFVALLVMEHLASELNRLLVAMSEPLLASIVLFIRSGLWTLILVPLMWAMPSLRQLEVVLLAWLVGSTFAVLVGTRRLLRLKLVSLSRPIDWRWLRRGLKVALPLLVGTLAVRGVFTFDRYWVEHIAGLDVLGAYTLFVGVASAILAFLDAGVFVFLYPAMITASQQGEQHRFNRAYRRLAAQTILITGVLTLGAGLTLPALLKAFDKSFYLAQLNMFYWVLLAIVLYALGMIPHYGLYASGNDRGIIVSHVIGLCIFMLAAWALAGFSAVLAVPQALCVAFAAVLGIKVCVFAFVRRPPAPAPVA